MTAALRVLALTAVAAAILRAIGAGVGTWAGGALGPASTVLIGVILPAWLFVFFPSWLAWRVLQPLGRPELAALACALSPLARARDLPSIRAFLAADAGRPLPAPGRLPADAWTALAAALQAGRAGSPARARRIAEALALLPAGSRFPWLARVHGVEALALAAAGRADWAACARAAALGRGRLVRLLARVAAALLGAGPPVPAWRLWLDWGLAPRRARTFGAVRAAAGAARAAAAAARVPAAAIPPPRGPTLADHREQDSRPDDPRRRHLFLIAAAARGAPIAVREVLALAAAWQAELDEAALGRLRARALELGAPRGTEQARALRETVLDQLTELVLRADGELAAGAPPGTLLDELAGRMRARLFARVETALADLGAGATRPAGAAPAALEAWERWLALRAALDALEARAGRVTFTSLWYGGLRNAVWSWTSALGAGESARAAWATHIVYAWLADRAEIVGDFPTTLANRENARLALAVAMAARPG